MDSMTNKTPPSDAATVTSLLLWARDKGIAVSELQVGTIRVVCADLQLAAARVRTSDVEPDPANLYRQYGGDLFEQAGRDLLETIIEDDDEGDESPASRGGKAGRRPSARASRRR
jgi:hypothetical protein